MFGFPALPSRGDLTDMFGIKSSFWPPPWSLFVLVAVIGLGLACWYCKQHCINFYVLNLFTSSSNHNTQEKLKTNKKNNKNVSISSMSEGYGPVLSLLSTKKSRQSFGIGGITALVAAFLVYAGLSNLSVKAQRFNAVVVDVGNTPPSSLPLDLPPPRGIVGEVAIEEVSSEYEDISSSFSPHTPKALASFLKDKAVSSLRGATVQTYFGPVNEDAVCCEKTADSGSVSVDLLPRFKSGFQHDGFAPVPSISKELRVEVSGNGRSRLNMSKASVSSTIGLDERVKVQHHQSPHPLHLFLKMMLTALILGAVFELYGISKSMFALRGRAIDMLVSRQSSRYSLRKNKKARQMSFTRLVQLVMLSIILSNVVTSSVLSSAYALDIGENVSGDNLEEMSSNVLGDEYEKVETEDQQGKNLIDDVVPDGHDTSSNLVDHRPAEKFEDHLLPDGLYDDSKDDEFDMMIKEYEQVRLYDDLKDDEYEMMIALMNEYEQEEHDRASDKAQLWPTKSDIKSSDMALIEKGQSSSEMKELEEFRRQQLRGSIEGDVNHLAIIPRIVDFLQHRVDEAKALKNIILNGNVAEAAAALSMYFDNTQAVAKIASSADENEEHALDFAATTNDGEGQLHGRKLQAFLSEVAPDELVNILHLNEDGIDEREHYVNIMEDVERKLIPESSRSRRSRQKVLPGAQGTLPNFSMNDKFKKPKLPKLKVVEQLKAKRGVHGRRRLEAVAPQCREKCQSDDFKCNCQRLVDYARKLTWYDASVMFLGGFVQGDPDVDDYGDLNVEYMSEIDMFGLRNQLPEKMQSINDRADEAERDMSETSCIALLSELHSACGAESCTEPNMDSFQLSVNQVGSSVNTTTKLKVEVIGEFYDFQQSTVRRDNFGNNKVMNTPLNERRPVRCCRDDEPANNEEIWYKSPVSISVTEPIRKVRIQLPSQNFLHLREVEVFDMNGVNIAEEKPATQSTTLDNRVAGNAVDGKLGTASWTENAPSDPRPSWEVDLGTSTQIRAVRIHNQASNSNQTPRLSNAIVTLYGDNNQEVARVQFGRVNWSQYTIVNRIAGCPYAWEQKWTGDVAVPALPVLSAVQVSSSAIGTANVGISNYSPLNNTWTLDGPSNGRISGTSDIFRYTNTRTTGEIDMRLRVTDYTGTTSSHCAGLMIRESLEVGSRHFSILYCGDKRVRRLRRNDVGGSTEGGPGSSRPVQTDEIEGPVWLRITFSNDNNFRVFYGSDGIKWEPQFSGGGFPGFTTKSNFFVGIARSNWILEASDFTINPGVPALPNDLTLPSTPIAVDGYTSYNQRMCNNDDQFLDVAGVEDEDGFIAVSSAQACASYCDKTLDCVSVDFLANEYCRLSSSCDHFSSTDSDVRSIWYFKNIAPPSYKKYGESLCKTGSSNLANTNANSVQECANQCSENHECVSFAYPTTNGSTECRLSSTCVEYSGMSDDSGWDTYAKKDRDDDEDEDVCPFLPFAQAEEYCADAGGRLCTRSELEDGCTSLMGCSFDTANVWSSTETEPMTCPATYQETCGNFVTAFELLYNGRNRTTFSEESPMRVNENDPANSTDFTNVQFPTGYNWVLDPESGIRTINPDNAYEYAALSNKPEDLFCGVTQGPPSVLAESCDDSMNFLLGTPVSIGSLRSTANSVDSFNPNEPTPEPHWLTWYTNLTDMNSINFYNEWTGLYEKIEDDPEDDPIWLGDYLNIKDPNPFIVSPTADEDDQSVLDEIYCVDETVYSGSLETCQQFWLNDKTNPYEDMDWYTSIPYPSSNVAPFNQICNDADFCKVDWLDNSTNPYSESTNAGCYAFYNDCREADPGRYRCKGFWEYCRTEQDSRNPGWKYPKENCNAGSWTGLENPNAGDCIDFSISAVVIDYCPVEWMTMDDNPYSGIASGDRLEYNCHVFFNYCKEIGVSAIETCPIEWLNNTVNPYTDEREQNESCYNFWNYCRNELDEINPDWVYPRPTCNDENGIEIETCQIAWLDDEENPYDDTNPECHGFWDYCRLELVTNHERYAWPLPAEPTVDDFMPGYCCLDTPTTDRTSEFWGDRYTEARANRGMKCKDRGEWYMGMSPEACHNGGGQFYRTACITLQRCIEARPREGEDGYRPSFEDWVIENEVEIYDPYIEEQCETARVALDYEPDHLDDQEICDTFNELLCDEFFEDLQWLEDEASEGPGTFEQVTYKPIEYPKDKPLFFKPLPNDEELITRSDEKEKNWSIWKDTVDTLEVSKRSLGFLKGNVKDGIDKFIAKQDAKLKAAVVGCHSQKVAYETSLNTKELSKNFCDGLLNVGGLTFGKVAGGVGIVKGTVKTNFKYNACIMKHKLSIKSTVVLKTKLLACESKKHVTSLLSDTQKFVLWAAHYSIKVAHEGVDTTLYTLSLKESKKVREYDYVEATYENVVTQFEWVHDALGVMNYNQIRQHTEMRDNLQSRHQDITNDVNQFTTCMSNYQGNEILGRLGAKTGSLSAKCKRMLGFSSNRRLDEGQTYELDLQVEWVEGSLIDKINKLIDSESKSETKENEIIDNQVDVKNITRAMRDHMAILQETVDGIAEKLDMNPKSDAKSKKSKKAKAQAAHDSEADDALFHRNLLAVEEVVNDKFDDMKSQIRLAESTFLGEFDAMKSQVKLVESKVASIEDKVELMESKVDRMEKTMEEMKEMLSQFIMRGAADA